jgi:hypothetical protein
MAFHVVTTVSQWGALFLAELSDMARPDLESHLSRGIEDIWEHQQFEFVKFEPEATIRYLLQNDRLTHWGEAAPPLFYLSLVNRFGRRKVDDACTRILREQPAATRA